MMLRTKALQRKAPELGPINAAKPRQTKMVIPKQSPYGGSIQITHDAKPGRLGYHASMAVLRLLQRLAFDSHRRASE